MIKEMNKILLKIISLKTKTELFNFRKRLVVSQQNINK